MIIQEINGKYIPEEDRILLRIKTSKNEEYRLWLTRNLTKNLTIELNNYIFEQEATMLLKQDLLPSETSSKDDKIQHNPKSIPLKNNYTSADILPLGPEPLLIHKLELTRQENNHQSYFILLLKLGSGVEIKCPIQQDILNSVQNLIAKLSTLAGWIKWVEMNSDKKININLNNISQSKH